MTVLKDWLNSSWNVCWGHRYGTKHCICFLHTIVLWDEAAANPTVQRQSKARKFNEPPSHQNSSEKDLSSGLQAVRALMAGLKAGSRLVGWLAVVWGRPRC